MKSTNSFLVKPTKNNPFLLLIITAFLITIYLTSTWKVGSDLVMSGLSMFVVCFMVWEKRQDLTLQSSLIAKLFGVVLIAIMLLKLSPELFRGSSFLFAIAQRSPISSVRVSIFIFAIGLGIIASGFQGLKQYWKELIIIFFVSISSVIVIVGLDPSLITAKFSSFLLWCLGFNVYLQDVYIYLPRGAVEVGKPCAGGTTIDYLLGISVILIFMFPLKRIYAIIVPIIGVTIAFVVNGFRVVLMAILVDSKDMLAFEYWHRGDGSLIFTMIASAIFVTFYFLLIRYSDIAKVD